MKSWLIRKMFALRCLRSMIVSLCLLGLVGAVSAQPERMKIAARG